MITNPQQREEFHEAFGGIIGHAEPGNIGPLAQDAMHTVGAKLGFGLHYHRTGKIVPAEGFVETRFRTNAEIYLRGLPPELMRDLGPVAVLAQGELTSDGHFGYRSVSSPDGTLGLYVAHLGRAFITISSVVFDATEMPATTSGQARRFHPGDLQQADARARSRY